MQSPWVIYSASPEKNEFGSLDSKQQAVWNKKSSSLSVAEVNQQYGGNRYVFNVPIRIDSGLSVDGHVFYAQSTLAYSKTYGQDATAALANGLSVGLADTWVTSKAAGAYLIPGLAEMFSTVPVYSSAGAAASAAAGTYGLSNTGVLKPGVQYVNAPPWKMTVTPAGLTVSYSVADATSTYGTLATLGAATLTGLVNGDVVSGSVGAFTSAGAAVSLAANTAAGTYVEKVTGLSGAAAANYAIAATGNSPGVLTINPLALNLAYSKTYSGNNLVAPDVGSLSLTGMVPGDSTPTISSGSATSTSANAGAWAGLASNSMTLSDPNYTLAGGNVVVTITPKALSVSGTAVQPKTYDGSAAAVLTGGLLQGVVAGDTALVGLTQAGSFDSVHAGSGIAVSAADALTGSAAGNYLLLQPAGLTGSINPAVLTVSLSNTAVSKVYDASTSAPQGFVPAYSVSGLVNGDTAAALATLGSSYNSADVSGASSLTATVGLSSISGPVSLVGDYVLGASTASVAATITPKALTVTANNAARFDGQLDASNFNGVSYAGFAGGQGASVLTGTAAVARTGSSTAVGSYAGDLVASGLGSSNYSISYVNGDYNVVGLLTLLVKVAPVTTGYGSAPSAYSLVSAAYMNGSSVVQDLTSTTTIGLVDGVLTATVNDGVSTALVPINVTNAVSSSSGNLVAGAYQLGVGTLSGAHPGFSSAQVVGNQTVTAAALSASANGVVSKVYDASTALNGVSLALAGIQSSSAGTDLVTATGLTHFADANAGVNKGFSIANLSLSGADATDYYLSNSVISGSNGIITPAPLTLAAVSSSKVYDGGTASSGAPTVSGLMSGDSVTLARQAFAAKNVLGAGGSVLSVSGYAITDGNSGANYQVSLTTATGTITPAALTVSGITAANKVYNGTTAAAVNVSGAVLTGLVSGDDVKVAATGVFADKNAAAGKVVALTSTGSGADLANYAVSHQASATANITPAGLTVSGITAASKVYDGTTAASVDVGGAVLTGLVAGDDVKVAATGLFADRNAAAGKGVALTSTGSGADLANYAVTNQASATADITPAALTVSGITAAAKTYDGTREAAVDTANAVLTGLLPGDSVTVAATGVFADKNAGTGKTVALTSVDGGADLANYAVTHQASTTADITPATLTVSGLNVAAKTYDGTAVASVNTANLVLTGLVAGDSVTVAATGAFFDKNAGAGKTVVLTSVDGGADVGNYSIVNQGSTTADITRAALTIAATSDSKVYDGTTASSATPTVSGLLGGDTMTSLAAQAFASANALGTGASNLLVNAGSVIADGNDGANYLVTLTPATGTITPAPLSTSLSYRVADAQSTYGTLATLGAATLTGVVSGDVVAGSVGVFTVGAVPVTLATNTPVGAYVEKVTGLTGAAASNYVVATSGNTDGVLTVNPLALTVAGTAVTRKTYDGTLLANLTGGALTGVVAGDTISLTQAGSFASAHAGSGVAVSAGYALTGAAAGNYTLTQPTGLTGDITPATLTASLSNTGISKTYDGTVNAPAGMTPTYTVTGFAAGDTAAGLQASSAAYNSANVGAATSLTVGGLNVISVVGNLGSSASDYVLASNSVAAAAAITPAALTVTANNAARFLPQADTAGFAGASYTGFVNGEGASALDTTALLVTRTDASSNVAVGRYAATLLPSGVLASNYSLSYVAGDFSILGAGLLLTLNKVSSTYGAAPVYSVASAQYMDGNNVVATLASSAITVDGGVVSVNDGAGGLANVPIAFGSPSLSGSGKLHVGAYQLAAGTLTGTNLQNFNNSVTLLGDASVTPLTVTAAVTSTVSKVYDGTTAMNGLTVGLTGALTNDLVAASAQQGAYASKHAGSAIGYSVSNLSLTGADALDYVLSATTLSASDGVISKALLTLAAVSSTKVYDGGTASSGVPTVSGLVSGDAITLAGQAFAANPSSSSGTTNLF